MIKKERRETEITSLRSNPTLNKCNLIVIQLLMSQNKNQWDIPDN